MSGRAIRSRRPGRSRVHELVWSGELYRRRAGLFPTDLTAISARVGFGSAFGFLFARLLAVH